MNEFWEKQSLKRVSYIHSISNLTKNQALSEEKSQLELAKVEECFHEIKRKFNSSIEIGAGTCQWTPILRKYSKSVLVTDTSISMLNIGKDYLKKTDNSQGISFFLGDILKEKFPQKSPYDLFFISGLILYLDEKKFLNSINSTNFSNLRNKEEIEGFEESINSKSGEKKNSLI